MILLVSAFTERRDGGSINGKIDLQQQERDGTRPERNRDNSYADPIEVVHGGAPAMAEQSVQKCAERRDVDQLSQSLRNACYGGPNKVQANTPKTKIEAPISIST